MEAISKQKESTSSGKETSIAETTKKAKNEKKKKLITLKTGKGNSQKQKGKNLPNKKTKQ